MAGEPVAYLIGEWEFMGRPLDISRDVLIPRDDTEVLAQRAIDLAAGLGGILWGQVIARWGFPAAFWGAAVLSALAAGATLFCGKRGFI